MARFALCAIGALTMMAGGAVAQTTPVTPAPVQFYSNTFESSLGSGWSSNAAVNAEATGGFSRFLGRYSQNDYVWLSLAIPSAAQQYNVGTTPGALPASIDPGTGGGGGPTAPVYQTRYRLMFDLYAIDSWDGLSPSNGQDWFYVKANGPKLFNHAIAQDTSMPQWTTYAGPRTAGPVHLGFNSAWVDSIFRNVSMDFTLPAGTSRLDLTFGSVGLLNLNDESWGIDNVRVSYEVVQVVPTPGTAMLAGMGGVLLVRRQRRA